MRLYPDAECVLAEGHLGLCMKRIGVRPRDPIELRTLHPLVEVDGTGVSGTTWLYDRANDEFLVILIKSGKLTWVPSAKLKVDASCFVDDRKVKEKQLGAYPGELGFDPEPGPEGDDT
jgi:hypothetical protein